MPYQTVFSRPLKRNGVLGAPFLYTKPMPESNTERETQRLEAFSDGVFAIAITLLILEIKVPHLEEGESLANALLHLWPSYGAYAFSFWVIGIFWVNHHSFFKLFRRVNHGFLLLNVLFLALISFIPFPTSVLAEYVTDPASVQNAVTFYCVSLLLPVLCWLSMWLYGNAHKLTDPHIDPGYTRFLTRQYAISNVLYIVAVLVSLFNAMLGLAIEIGLAFLYFLPQRAPSYRNPGLEKPDQVAQT
jgi:uncharacterized membrane protein